MHTSKLVTLEYLADPWKNHFYYFDPSWKSFTTEGTIAQSVIPRIYGNNNKKNNQNPFTLCTMVLLAPFPILKVVDHACNVIAVGQKQQKSKEEKKLYLASKSNALFIQA